MQHPLAFFSWERRKRHASVCHDQLQGFLLPRMEVTTRPKCQLCRRITHAPRPDYNRVREWGNNLFLRETLVIQLGRPLRQFPSNIVMRRSFFESGPEMLTRYLERDSIAALVYFSFFLQSYGRLEINRELWQGLTRQKKTKTNKGCFGALAS